MKKTLFFIFLSTLLFSCKEKVEIVLYNNHNIDRKNEIIDFCFCEIKDKINFKQNDKIIILDKDNKQVPYQVLADNRSIIFPANVKANDSATYTVMVGVPDSFSNKTYGKQVPERKDDMTWENDRIAFRMYGPALANEGPSNGVDVWLKRTNKLVIDKFYKNDLAKIESYHVDNGEGLDCYKVGHTLGAGGIAPYLDNKLFIGKQYDRFEVTENGPLRTTFKLSFDSVEVNNSYISQDIFISIDAGSQLNKAKVFYYNIKDPNLLRQLAIGIYLHDSIDTPITNLRKGYMGYAENAVSNAGIPSGRSYVGVFVPTLADSMKIQDNHLLSFVTYNQNKAITYYFGGGWSKWGFAKDKDWEEYLNDFADRKTKPILFKIRKAR